MFGTYLASEIVLLTRTSLEKLLRRHVRKLVRFVHEAKPFEWLVRCIVDCDSYCIDLALGFLARLRRWCDVALIKIYECDNGYNVFITCELMIHEALRVTRRTHLFEVFEEACRYIAEKLRLHVYTPDAVRSLILKVLELALPEPKLRRLLNTAALYVAEREYVDNKKLQLLMWRIAELAYQKLHSG